MEPEEENQKHMLTESVTVKGLLIIKLTNLSPLIYKYASEKDWCLLFTLVAPAFLQSSQVCQPGVSLVGKECDDDVLLEDEDDEVPNNILLEADDDDDDALPVKFVMFVFGCNTP